LGEGADADLGALYCVHVTSTKRAGRTQTQLEDTFGLGLNGAYAEFAVAPASALVRVPDCVPPAIAAVAADAGTTTWNAVNGVAQVRPGQRVLIIGVGGLGLLAVQIAVLAGVEDLSVSDPRSHALELATRFGAKRTFTPQDLNTAIVGGFGVDVVIDFVSTAETFRVAREALREVGTQVGRRGRLVIVGVGHEDVKINLADIILTPIEGFDIVIPTLYGKKEDLASVLDLLAQVWPLI
ncbi:NAD(P)-binding protein, partial [Exidia glandulosa HHB12029]